MNRIFHRLPLFLGLLAGLLTYSGVVRGAELLMPTKQNPARDGNWIEEPPQYWAKQPSPRHYHIIAVRRPKHHVHKKKVHPAVVLMPVQLRIPNLQDHLTVALPEREELVEEPFSPPERLSVAQVPDYLYLQ